MGKSGRADVYLYKQYRARNVVLLVSTEQALKNLNTQPGALYLFPLLRCSIQPQ